MDIKKSGLTDLVRADSKIHYAASIVKRHYAEILQLKSEWVPLKEIHEKICQMYKKDIEEKRLTLSLPKFYRIYHKIEKQGFKEEPEREIVKPEKKLPQRSTLKEWDSSSGVDHPFKK